MIKNNVSRAGRIRIRKVFRLPHAIHCQYIFAVSHVVDANLWKLLFVVGQNFVETPPLKCTYVLLCEFTRDQFISRELRVKGQTRRNEKRTRRKKLNNLHQVLQIICVWKSVFFFRFKNIVITKRNNLGKYKINFYTYYLHIIWNM